MEIRVSIQVWEVDSMSNEQPKFVGETIFNLTIPEVPYKTFKNHQKISQFANIT